jgi:hypothetical protein
MVYNIIKDICVLEDYMVDNRKRITVNFRENNEIDDDLYNYIIEKSKVIGVSNAIKQIISEYKESEERGRD